MPNKTAIKFLFVELIMVGRGLAPAVWDVGVRCLNIPELLSFNGAVAAGVEPPPYDG